jgi:hypothetical protein
MSIDERLAKVEQTVGRIEDTQDRIADSLERLVRLETLHAETRQSVDRAFRYTEKVAGDIEEKLDEIGTRLRSLEEKQPVTNLAVYFIGVLVLGALAAIGTAVLKAVGMAGAP